MRPEWKPVKARITILVDNTVMELIPDTKLISRLSKPNNSFVCEHGFSALIESGGKKILIDTGSTGLAVIHNLKLLGISAEDIDLIVLSHGHYDHTGGLKYFSSRIIAHQDSFYRRYLVTPSHIKLDLTCSDSNIFKDRVEFHREPVKLADGIWTTGEIKRRQKWEELKIFKIKKNNKIIPDNIKDDQAVVISSKKGLVIISGCGHAGIINTVEQAIEISGIKNVYCVIGGFHLIGPGEAKIGRTLRELKRLNVQKVIPVHCTGFEAIKRISIEMPEKFEYMTAGCRIDL